MKLNSETILKRVRIIQEFIEWQKENGVGENGRVLYNHLTDKVTVGELKELVDYGRETSLFGITVFNMIDGIYIQDDNYFFQVDRVSLTVTINRFKK